MTTQSKLDNSKSPGLAAIHPRAVKELKCEIAELLAKMCNLSLQGVTESGGWNINIANPIHRQGSREVD